ncbi:MAG TPA: fibronectin type III domain-containing protein [Terriglobia bacterium]|nr:fibronectin type III domain-containing protein [Terriglobia bacterium]
MSKGVLFLVPVLVLVLVLIVSATPQVSSSSYGLEWPGDGAVRRMLYWHNPFPIYDATYIFKVYPRKKTTGPYRYYTTFFWGNDGNFVWNGGNANTYYGAHPYPRPAPAGPGQWEISVASNDYTTGTEIQWNRWHIQAFRAWRESPSITHHEFYYDLPDTSKVITHTVDHPNWAIQNPPTPAIVMGQAPDLNGASWGGYPGWEEFNGIIRGIQIYSGLLSVSDIQAEINAPKSTAAGQTFIWYLNTDPRPGDVTDKKGTGTPHNPSWAGTTALEWSDQLGDTSAPSTPANLAASAGSSSQINLSWTASTDNVGVTGYSVERCQGSGCTSFTAVSTPGGTSYSDTGLAANTLYSYRVRATDAAGNLSSYSSIASATTLSASTGSTISFTIPAEGGQSWATTGQTESLSAGYGLVQQDTGSSGVSGLAIFGFRPAGVLITEATVPATPATSSGRIYMEVNRPVSTGIAFANPNSQPAVISFYFTDTAGSDLPQGSFTLDPNSQRAAFLDQAPFNGRATQGTFTYSSSLPVGVIAIRGLTNERGEFLITTLPVWAVGDNNTNPIVLPHFADGGGWTTQILLTNPSNSQLSGYAEFFSPGSTSQNGTVLNLTVNGSSSSRFDYLIPSRSSVRLVTGGSSSTTQAGSVRITPAGMAPTAMAVFSFKNNGVTVSEAGVSAPGAGLAFRMYVEVSGSPGQIGSIESGVAMANPSAAAVTVNLDLVGMDGRSTSVPRVTVTVPGSGQLARFIRELFPSLSGSFQGFLKATAGAPVVVTGVRGRVNERREFLTTTTLPRSDDVIPPVSQLVFPHIASGGGYTTQFIIYGPPGTGRLVLSPLTGAVR